MMCEMRAFSKQVNAAIVDPGFITNVCKKLDLDQREAAEIFGGGINAFSRYENGKTKPPLALVKLFKLLDRPPTCSTRSEPPDLLKTRRFTLLRARTVFENYPATSARGRAVFSKSLLADHRICERQRAYEVLSIMKKVKVLFCCMGNICRSPTAEGVFRRLVRDAGLEREIFIDSAGTHAYHIGSAPDKRACAAAEKRGYDLSALRGRQVSLQDFYAFDYILAMDCDNLVNLQRICPPDRVCKLSLFMEFSPGFREREVPDPYYGGAQGFERVLDMVEDAARGLLQTLAREREPRA